MLPVTRTDANLAPSLCKKERLCPRLGRIPRSVEWNPTPDQPPSGAHPACPGVRQQRRRVGKASPGSTVKPRTQLQGFRTSSFPFYKGLRQAMYSHPARTCEPTKEDERSSFGSGHVGFGGCVYFGGGYFQLSAAGAASSKTFGPWGMGPHGFLWYGSLAVCSVFPQLLPFPGRLVGDSTSQDPKLSGNDNNRILDLGLRAAGLGSKLAGKSTLQALLLREAMRESQFPRSSPFFAAREWKVQASRFWLVAPNPEP